MFPGSKPLKGDRGACITMVGQNKKQVHSAQTPSYAYTHRHTGTSENNGMFPGNEPLKPERWACITPLGQNKKQVRTA